MYKTALVWVLMPAIQSLGAVEFSLESGTVFFTGTSSFTDTFGMTTTDNAGDEVVAPDCCVNDVFFIGGGGTSTGGVDGEAFGSTTFVVSIDQSDADANRFVIEFFADTYAFVDQFNDPTSGFANILSQTTAPLVLKLVSDTGPLAYSVIEDNFFIGPNSSYTNELPRGFSSGFINPGEFAISFDLSASYSTNTGGNDFEDIRYVLEISLPHRCDINGDSACDNLDLRDLYDAIEIAAAGGPTDINGSGVTDNEDIGAWLADAGAANGKTYLPGDVDLNGEVGGADFTIFASNFGVSGLANAHWEDGNFDGNGGGVFDVGGADFTALAGNFGHVSMASVPEPSAMVLTLAWFGLVSATRSRRVK